MRPAGGRPSRRKGKEGKNNEVKNNEGNNSKEPEIKKEFDAFFITDASHESNDPEDENELPPEFRTAGLIAQMEIAKGKVFGPFAGVIIDKEDPPSSVHTFVCKVKDSTTQRFKHFYAKKEDKSKCNWLKMIQPPFGDKSCNVIAYNRENGVCYEAVKDIPIGEELLALFQSTAPGAPKKWTIKTRRKSATIMKLTLSNQNSISKEQPPGTTRKRERSRKGAPRRYIKQPVTLDHNENADIIEASGMAPSLPEIEVNAADASPNTNNPLPAKRRRRSKVLYLEDAFVSSNEEHSADEDDDPTDKDFRPTEKLKSSSLLKCSKCKKEFKYSETYEKHVEGNLCRKKKGYECEDCGTTLRDKKYLKRHRLSFHTEHQCKECQLKFTKLMDLKKHVREKHTEKKDLYSTCKICNKKFSRSYLVEHVKSHEKAFECNICNKPFSCRSNLRKHLKKHKPDYKPKKQVWIAKKMKCDVCEKVLNGRQGLKAHMRLHTGERPFKCDKCDWAFVQGSHLRRHKKFLHGDGKIEGKLQCPTCSRWYSNEEVLELHINTIHKGLRPFKCTMCKDTFNIQGLLLRHQRELHQMEVDLPEDQRKYICKQEGCGKKFSLQSDLNKHIFEHTGVHPFQCKECDRFFSSSGNLGKHVRRIHRGMKIPDYKPANSDGKFRCTLCEKLFTNAGSLREHSRIHTGERISCAKCSSTFVQRSGLRKHLRCLRCPGLRKELEENGETVTPKVYTRRRAWECDQCEKNFTGPSDLKAHKRVHTGERPFTCEVCGKSFTQQGNLTKHEKYVHGGEKRPKESKRERKYSCSMCCKSFSSPGDLSMHCRTHTGVKPFECTHCGMAFTQRGNLKKHIVRWHTMNASSKSRSKAANQEGQEERVVIKGLETSSSTSSNSSMTCSVVLPPSFITNNKEVLVTNVPISMAAMLKQKATEVANSSQPSSLSVTSLIQCLTVAQKNGSSTSVTESSESTSESTEETETTIEPRPSSPPSAPSSTFTNRRVTLPDMNIANPTFSTQSIPAVSSFIKLTEPQTSCAQVYPPIDLVKNFISSKPPTSNEEKQQSSIFTPPQQPSSSNLAAKDINRVQDLLTDSSLLDMGSQKSSTGAHVSAPALNFTGDFTGQVRGMELTQNDIGNSRFRLPVRSTPNRLQPDVPKGLHLPFENPQLPGGSFLNSPRLTHPDLPRQSCIGRRPAFTNVMDAQGEFTVPNSHSTMQHSFTNASLAQPLPSVGNYFHSPGKILNPPWDPANIRNMGMHANDSQTTAMMIQKSFQIIGGAQSEGQK